MIPDYYTLLGVSPTASTTEIKRAYRNLARQHHPDLNDRAKDEQIKRLNEAYAVLSDSQKRESYDRLRKQERQRAEAARRQREQEQREPQMTWAQGVMGFVREFKKGLRND